MKNFKKFSEVDLSVLEPKSEDEITRHSRLHEMGFVVDMMEQEELKGDWEAVNRQNALL
jgi:hypothetical protein